MGGLQESRKIHGIGLRCGLVMFSASGLLEASTLLMHPKISCDSPLRLWVRQRVDNGWQLKRLKIAQDNLALNLQHFSCPQAKVMICS